MDFSVPVCSEQALHWKHSLCDCCCSGSGRGRKFWPQNGALGKSRFFSKNEWTLLTQAFGLCIPSCSTCSVDVMPEMEQQPCDHENKLWNKRRSWTPDIWVLLWNNKPLICLSCHLCVYVYISCPKWGEFSFAPQGPFVQISDLLQLKMDSPSLSPTPLSYVYFLYWSVGNLYTDRGQSIVSRALFSGGLQFPPSLGSCPSWVHGGLFYFEFTWHFKSYCPHWIMKYFILLFSYMDSLVFCVRLNLQDKDYV